MADITSANAVFMLDIPNVLGVAVPIQGFAVDDMFTAEVAESVEARMGADGRLSGGFTPYPVKTPVHLQADSPSVDVFEQWDAVNKTPGIQSSNIAQASIDYFSIGKVYTLTNGHLTRVTPFAGAKKVLEPTEWEITWELVIVSPGGLIGSALNVLNALGL